MKVPSDALPNISVVMPSFNQAEFIESAVRSVLSQGVESLELVVMDGGSNDGTQDALRRLEVEFGPSLRWHSETDSGPANAINKAAALAQGTVLGWLSSDDLYAPGAVQRALDHFTAHPDHVMVYGEAEHVDANGQFMERYPSLRPEVGVDHFREGCYICQPSVFILREAWMQMGGLDESYRASFDFEMWLRMFRAFPGRIGFIDAVQAKSRLHEGGITLRFREQVAREGIRLLSDAFGRAPAHWLLTCFEELLADSAQDDVSEGMESRLRQLFAELAPRIAFNEHARIRSFLDNDRRLGVSHPGLRVPISGDGWASRQLAINYRPVGKRHSLLRLNCRHASPVGGPLTLTVFSNETEIGVVHLSGNGPFLLDLALSGSAREPVRLQIEARECFVPATVEAGSQDNRELAYQVESTELL